MVTKQQIIEQNEQHKLMTQTNSLNDTINFYSTQLILLNHSLSTLSHDSNFQLPQLSSFQKEKCSTLTLRLSHHIHIFYACIFITSKQTICYNQK